MSNHFSLFYTTPKSEKRTDVSLGRQWNAIDWEKVRENVNRIQTRIAKAVSEGKFNLAKRLQYLLTHSFHAKLLAVRIVTQNRGKRTPGIDGELWTSSKDKMLAVLSLSDKQYQALPLKWIYIPKPGKETKRPLSIPTMYDRAMQALYALALQPVAETLLLIHGHSDLDSSGVHKMHRSTSIYACVTKLEQNGYLKEIS